MLMILQAVVIRLVTSHKAATGHTGLSPDQAHDHHARSVVCSVNHIKGELRLAKIILPAAH